MSTLKELRSQFLSKVAARMEVGASEYGNLSFFKPGTPEEILEEVEDIAGWSYVLWVKLKMRLEAVQLASDELFPDECAACGQPQKRRDL